MVFPQKSGFLLYFFIFLPSSYATCFCRLLVQCVVCVILVRKFDFRRLVAALSGVMVIQTTKQIQSSHQAKSWSSICYRTGVICILVIIELSNV